MRRSHALCGSALRAPQLAEQEDAAATRTLPQMRAGPPGAVRAVFCAGRKFFGSPVNRGVEGVEIGAGVRCPRRARFLPPARKFLGPLARKMRLLRGEAQVRGLGGA